MWSQVEQALNQSAARVLSRVAQLLPELIALCVAVVFAALLAWLVSAFLRRALNRVDFDSRLGRWGLGGLADWAPSRSPTLLLGRLVSWSIILVGFLVGATAFDTALTSPLVLQAFGYIPNILAALALLIAGKLVAAFVARSVLIGAVNLQLEYARLLSAGVRWLVLVLAAAMALKHLGIGAGIVDLAFGILFGGIVLTLALAIGLGSKDLVSRSLESRPRGAEQDRLQQHL